LSIAEAVFRDFRDYKTKSRSYKTRGKIIFSAIAILQPFPRFAVQQISKTTFTRRIRLDALASRAKKVMRKVYGLKLLKRQWCWSFTHNKTGVTKPPHHNSKGF
jgi:hypothetical protein